MTDAEVERQTTLPDGADPVDEGGATAEVRVGAALDQVTHPPHQPVLAQTVERRERAFSLVDLGANATIPAMRGFDSARRVTHATSSIACAGSHSACTKTICRGACCPASAVSSAGPCTPAMEGSDASHRSNT